MIKTLPTGNSGPGHLRGFTLIEILIVLTIMAVLTSAISYLFLDRQETLKSVAHDIVQNMHIIRQQAIRDDRPYQVEIDLEQNSLRFINEVVELSAEVSLTVRTAENQVISDVVAGMTFYPDASSSGGVITLEDENEIFEISVIWISGKIQTRHRPRAA